MTGSLMYSNRIRQVWSEGEEFKPPRPMAVRIDPSRRYWEAVQAGRTVLQTMGFAIYGEEECYYCDDEIYQKNARGQVLLEESAFSDPIGSGKRLVFQFIASERPTFTASVYAYENIEAVSTQVTIHNETKGELHILEMYPVYYGRSPIFSGGLTDPVRIYTEEYERAYEGTRWQPLQWGIWTSSPYLAALLNERTQEVCVLGALTFEQGLTSFQVCRRQGLGSGPFTLRGSCDARSAQRGVRVPPGGSFSSDRVLILLGRNVWQTLEQYGDLVREFNGFQFVQQEPHNDWRDYDYYISAIYRDKTYTPEETRRNIEFIGKHLKPYGVKAVMSLGDQGDGTTSPNQRNLGNHGLREQVYVGEIHGDFGDPRHIASLEKLGNELRERKVSHVMTDWTAIRMHKDWMRCGFNPIQFVRPGERSNVQMQRDAYAAFRRALGNEITWHANNAALGTVIGYCDSFGLVEDTIITLPDDEDQQPRPRSMFTHAVYTFVPAMAVRWWMRGRFFHFDNAGELSTCRFTPTQARSIATLSCMAWGHCATLSDPLYALDEEQLDIIKSTVTPYPEADGRPLDLLERHACEVWRTPVVKPFGRWEIIALFNWDECNSTTKTVSWNQLQLPPEQDYLAFEFWRKEFFGRVRDPLTVSIEPGGCKVFAFVPVVSCPWYLASSRHLLAAGVDLQEHTWDPRTGILRGRSQVVPDATYRMYLYLPPGYVPQNQPGAYQVKRTAPECIEVSFPAGCSAGLDWSIPFKCQAAVDLS